MEDPCIGVRGLERIEVRRFKLTEAADRDFEYFLQGIKPKYVNEMAFPSTLTYE